MRTLSLTAALCILSGTCLSAQTGLSDSLYKDRTDSLEATVFTATGASNYLSKISDIRTEVISASGLCKMACCSVAESFENSASVTVGYSDAVTGARQIKLLGLSGVYTQMLDESRPVMRGLASPFGLSWVPGQWLNGIQIAKGVTSVIGGSEAMTGQINMEHRKPTDEKPLFVNLSIMSNTMTDFNVASSLQMGDRWSTVLLGHVNGNFISMDENGDGFLDDPKALNVDFANRWLYFDPSGIQIRFGFNVLNDRRKGGQYDPNDTHQPGYDHSKYTLTSGTPWGTDINTSLVDGYFKFGMPVGGTGLSSVAAVLDYNYQKMESWFGATAYDAGQHSAHVNLLYQNHESDIHHFTVGASANYDYFDDCLSRVVANANQGFAQGSDHFFGGAFGEYTLRLEDKFSLIAGLRGDYYSGYGFRPVPRLTFKYSPIEDIIIRFNAGRGLRYSSPLTDNFGVFSTGKAFLGDCISRNLEDSWTVGGNITYYIKAGPSKNCYVSLDAFYTTFTDKLIVDYERKEGYIWFYSLSDLATGSHSNSTNVQLDFFIEPVRRLECTLTFRYTDARESLWGQGYVEKPMVSRYKGVLNLQYATNLRKWIFDFTASLNGPCKVYDFMQKTMAQYSSGYSSIYPLLYLQVTRRFKMVDVYIGGENLTNFKQADPIISASDPSSSNFDASCIWGPVSGIKVYAGMRLTLWKK